MRNGGTGAILTDSLTQTPSLCPGCAKSLPPAGRFCPHCGRPVAFAEPTLAPGPLVKASQQRMADAPPFPMLTWNGFLVAVGQGGTVQVFAEHDPQPVLQEGLPLDADLSSPALLLEGLLIAPGGAQAAVFDLASRVSQRAVEPARAQRLPLGGPLTSAAATDGRRWLAAPVRVGDRSEIRIWEYRPRRGLEPRPTLRPAAAQGDLDLHVWLVGDHLYAGVEGGTLTGYDLAAGTSLDTLAIPSGLKFSPVARSGPVPLARSQQEALYRLPAAAGHALQPLFHPQGESLWTWAEDGRALWVVAGSHLYRVDPRGGGETRLALRESGALCPALTRHGAFVLTPAGWLTSVRAANGQLEQVGHQRLYEGTAARSGAPAVLGGTLYVVDPEGNLAAWRPAP